MTNKILQAHFQENIRGALARAAYVQSVNHAGLRGQLREIFAKQLIEPLLPPGFGIGRGKVVDMHGNQSAECDLVIYERRILPPVLFDETTGLFPLEACRYCIEVKSELTAHELETTIEKFRKLRSLHPMSGGKTIPITLLFAYKSDLSKKHELDRYLEADPAPYESYPLCNVICVVGRCYAYWHQKKNEWKNHSIDEDFEEVITLLGGIANTFAELVGGLKLGHYILNKKVQS